MTADKGGTTGLSSFLEEGFFAFIGKDKRHLKKAKLLSKSSKYDLSITESRD